MSLPILNTPKYKLELPGSKKKVEYRPFLVKEEKILMIAQEAENQEEILTAISELLKCCTYDKLDIMSLPMIDIETLFMNIRAKSVGETFKITCECDSCKAQNLVEFNVADVKALNVSTNKGSESIKLNGEIGITLKHPTFGVYVNTLSTQAEKKTVEQFTDVIRLTIDSIWDNENTYSLNDSTEEEAQRFIDSMSHKNLQDIMEFIANTPKLSVSTKFDCQSCHAHCNKTFEGLNSFFA